MKVAVQGLWHLGAVLCACLAEMGHQVMGFDPSPDLAEGLRRGKAPLFEPGLDELLASGIQNGNLSFPTAPQEALADAEVLWVAFDTPVDGEDRADVGYVTDQVLEALAHVRPDCVVLVSSQVPAGTCRFLQDAVQKARPGSDIRVACSPENLRLGSALKAFRQPGRVVVGIPDEGTQARLEALWSPLAPRIEWMSVPSAEMTKHAVNGFLALSVVFINELASLCEKVGADAREVSRGLKSEERIGPKAYLNPGAAFAGGTLARDLVFLEGSAASQGLDAAFFSAVLASNRRHKDWPKRILTGCLGDLSGKTVAVLGLAYKEGTDTLRRSESLLLCRWLALQGARVQAYDPLVHGLPSGFPPNVLLADGLEEALTQSHAVILSGPSKEWEGISLGQMARRDPAPIVLDPDGRLAGQQVPAGLPYFRVGFAPTAVR
jgi:UDPglucose 6-dehydrogenase